MIERATVVTRKGQVTVPIEIRRILGIKVGDRLGFVLDDDQQVRVVRLPSVVEQTAGIVRHDGPPPTIDELSEAFERGVAAEVVARMRDEDGG